MGKLTKIYVKNLKSKIGDQLLHEKRDPVLMIDLFLEQENEEKDSIARGIVEDIIAGSVRNNVEGEEEEKDDDNQITSGATPG